MTHDVTSTRTAREASARHPPAGGGGLTAPEVLDVLEADGAALAYTTVSTGLDRSVEKAVLDRTSEVHVGSRRYRYAFDPDAHADEFVATAVEDVQLALGDDGLDRLVEQASDCLPPTNP